MSATNNAIRVAFEPVRELAFGSIDNTYTEIGTPLEFPARLIIIQNDTDQTVIISFDGVHDHLVLISGQAATFDFTGNRSDFGGTLCVAANTQLWVTAPVMNPASGSVFVTVMYGQD